MDHEQFKVLFPLLFKLPHAVMYYLNEIIFPEVLAYQNLKLSACGQELGGDMLFGRRIGFSGTPSDILPQELGSCQYEKGSDGKVVHYLTHPAVVRHVNIPLGWSVASLLNYIATAQPPFLALIDTGALITGMSNRMVSETLLASGLVGLKGVVSSYYPHFSYDRSVTIPSLPFDRDRCTWTSWIDRWCCCVQA